MLGSLKGRTFCSPSWPSPQRMILHSSATYGVLGFRAVQHHTFECTRTVFFSKIRANKVLASPEKVVAWPTRIQFVEALVALAAAKRAPFTLERAAGVVRTGVHQRRLRLRTGLRRIQRKSRIFCETL